MSIPFAFGFAALTALMSFALAFVGTLAAASFLGLPLTFPLI